MKINLLNTLSGLKPCYDDDFDEKKKLKLGLIYCAEIKLVRNYEFHQKYFAMLNAAYQYLNEEQLKKYPTVEKFRKSIQIASGWCEPYYSIKHQEFREESKSIDFGSMTGDEFSTLYDNVKNTLFATVLRNISQEEFMKNLINF